MLNITETTTFELDSLPDVEAIRASDFELDSLPDAEAIRASDPLHMDQLFEGSIIPSLNEQGDILSLSILLRQYLPTIDSLAGYPDIQIHALARDLGILVGSITRFTNPFSVVPELQEVYQVLYQRRGMSPFHTVYDYGLWNPKGNRRRRFTDTRQEAAFIASVETGMQALHNSLSYLVEDVNVEAILNARAAFDPMVAAIIQVMKDVGGEFFAKELRPFFNPITLEDRLIEAPGGAQMPILLIDHLLWASDTSDVRYIDYRNKNLAYLPASLRIYILQTSGVPSIIRRVGPHDEHMRQAISKFIMVLASFRKPHEKLARDSFGHRGVDEIGSGGYQPDILTHINDLTYQQIRAVRYI